MISLKNFSSHFIFYMEALPTKADLKQLDRDVDALIDNFINAIKYHNRRGNASRFQEMQTNMLSTYNLHWGWSHNLSNEYMYYTLRKWVDDCNLKYNFK